MVDFRYLLITVVAIFLALTVGIALGAGFLGEPLREGLEHSVDSVRRDNNKLTDQVAQLRDDIGERQTFAERLEPVVTDNVLAGRPFVLLSFDGTDGKVTDSIRRGLEESGANLVTTVSFSDKLALASRPERDQIATIVESISDQPDKLRDEVAGRIGQLSSSVAGSDLQQTNESVARRLDDLLGQLQDAGYAAIESVEDATVPGGAGFLIAGGATEQPPFPAAPFAERLGIALTNGGATTMVLESTDSVWGMVSMVRDSGEANSEVSTVDQIETVQGRIAMVLGLSCPSADGAGHFGVGADATELLPEACTGG